jgi:hypothetical protein
MSKKIIKKRLLFLNKKQINCSPTHNDKNYTCLCNESLFKLKNLWNERHPDSKITSNEPKEIWKSIQSNLKNVCNKETCWLKQQFVNGELNKELENAYAPISPEEWKKNPNEWLSSVDIIKVMKQYEDAYRCFDFIGPSPIDYDTKMLYGNYVWPELANFNLNQQLKDGKTKIGIIFNTDPHTKGGEHWISLFINIKTKLIFFYDSVGSNIPSRIKKFVNNVKEQGERMIPPIHFTFDQNYKIEHQKGDGQCGIYSIFFIIHMLQDKITPKYLKTHILTDKYMQNFRKVYFNQES